VIFNYHIFIISRLHILSMTTTLRMHLKIIQLQLWYVII